MLQLILSLGVPRSMLEAADIAQPSILEMIAFEPPKGTVMQIQGQVLHDPQAELVILSILIESTYQLSFGDGKRQPPTSLARCGIILGNGVEFIVGLQPPSRWDLGNHQRNSKKAEVRLGYLCGANVIGHKLLLE